MWFLLKEANFIGRPNAPLPKKTHQNMHLQLINMNLQEGMVIKGI
jgi:hypothetical protein